MPNKLKSICLPVAFFISIFLATVAIPYSATAANKCCKWDSPDARYGTCVNCGSSTSQINCTGDEGCNRGDFKRLGCFCRDDYWLTNHEVKVTDCGFCSPPECKRKKKWIKKCGKGKKNDPARCDSDTGSSTSRKWCKDTAESCKGASGGCEENPAGVCGTRCDCKELNQAVACASPDNSNSYASGSESYGSTSCGYEDPDVICEYDEDQDVSVLEIFE